MRRDFDWIDVDAIPSPEVNTPWGMVSLARGTTPEAAKARGELAELYRGAIYFMILGMVRGRERAAELTQGFLVSFLEGRVFTLADQTKGSFRVFLKAWVRNHVRTEQKKERLRRGAPLKGTEVGSDAESPERVLDRKMTQAEVTEALRRAREQLRPDSEAMRAFDAWQLDRSPDDRRTQAEMAREMGLSLRRFQDSLAIARQAVRFYLIRILSLEVATREQLDEELTRVREALGGPLAGLWSRR